MSACKIQSVVNRSGIWCTYKTNFSTSSQCYNAWRKRQGLEPNPNVFGPLRNLPDYSFVDGRPVPLGFKKSEALQLQKKYYERIVELSNELDVGLEQYYINIQKSKENSQAILDSKLKPKGAELLKENNKKV